MIRISGLEAFYAEAMDSVIAAKVARMIEIVICGVIRRDQYTVVVNGLFL